MSHKVELTVEFLLSDWLEATQVTGFVLIRIFETFACEAGRKHLISLAALLLTLTVQLKSVAG